jgi:hypothetical protein
VKRPATMAQLRERLAEFQHAYELCSYIDSYPAVERCRADNQYQIDRIKAEIAAREARGEESDEAA